MNSSDGPPVSGYERKQPPVATSFCAEVSVVNSRMRFYSSQNSKRINDKIKTGTSNHLAIDV